MQNTHRLAFAALALLGSTAAFAQSSVTLYGRVNTTVERQKIGDSTVTGLFNNASRFGFKGVEDLGGGLKAGFQLESGFNSDTGTTDSRGFFARQSEVNLSGGFGMVRLGRWTAESYFATADYVSLHNHDTGSSADAFYASVMRNQFTNSNSVAYRTPSFGGLTVEGAVSMHEQTSGGKNLYDLAANYNLGALALGAGYSKLGDSNQFALRALYTTGPFMVGAYYQRSDDWDAMSDTAAAVGKRDNFRLSGAYIMGASEFHLNVGRANSYKNLTDSAATQYTLGYNYNLSKRTKVYGYYTRVNNDRNASYATGVAGADFSSVAVGVRHNF
ncbi:porin [Paracidovorax citrulli]|uniref:porin n=1 Tax=Paracidovorax citrulli TaxID=80869 RepID=UPI0003160232|nr:porin [Paracidovorax citrulli]QCX10243.1 Outer membrane porin protein 32 [Paracidovorax citrulli]UEG46767.1 porin [Paracidovorax citrulli]UMT89978.1 porin [Paracidovorax citrulli]UMT94013.1 porin [Paracidovorax citrulli]WIY35229.1 porin [Paracidovorax citrulli]